MTDQWTSYEDIHPEGAPAAGPQPSKESPEPGWVSYEDLHGQAQPEAPPIGGDYSPSYWEDPTRVGRALNFLATTPAGATLPTWLDANAVRSAAQVFAWANETDQWDLWKPLQPDDPARSFLQSIPAPPADALLPWEERFAPTAPEQPATNLETGGLTPEQYEALDPWQKLVMRVFSTTKTSGAAIGAVAGLQAGPAGIIPGALLGSAMGGLSEQVPKLAQWLSVLDYPAEWLERATGVTAMLGGAVAGELTRALGGQANAPTVGELLQHLDAAAKAAHLTAEVTPIGGPGAWTVGTPQEKILQPEELGLGAMYEAFNRIVVNNESPEAVYQDVLARVGFQGQMRDLAFHIFADPLNILGFGLVRGAAPIARLMGANEKLVKALKTSTGMIDFLHDWGSELRAMTPKAEISEMGSVSRWLAGIDKAGKVYGLERPGRLEGFLSTRPVLNKLGGATLTGGGAGLIGLSFFGPVGGAIGLGIGGLGGGKLGLSYLTHLTASSKATEIAQVSMVNIMKALGETDIEPLEKLGLLRQLKDTPALVARELSMRSLESPDAAALPLILRDFDDQKGIVLEANWNATAEGRQMLQDIGAMLGKQPGEVLQEMAKATDSNTLLTQYIEAARAAGDAGRPIVQAFEDGILTKDLIDDSIKAFIKDGVPFDKASFDRTLFAELWDHTDAWAAKWFNVKPDPAWIRLGKAVKTLQSLVLLGFSPPYAMGNTIDNIATMAATDILGFRTRGMIYRLWNDRVGMVPPRLAAGIGASGEGVIQLKNIHKASLEPGLLEDITRRTANINDKVGIFSKFAARFEQLSSEQATTSAFLQFWGRHWKIGTGFDALPPELERALGPDGVHLVYQAVQGGMNQKEIEAALWSGTTRKTAASLLPDVAEAMGKTESDLRETLDGVGALEYINSRLPPDATDAQVHQAFEDFRREAESHLDKLYRNNLAADAEKAATKTGGEGAAAALEIFKDLEIEEAVRGYTNFDDWEDVWAQIKRLPDYEAGGRLIKAQFRIESRSWNRLWENKKAGYLGITNALGIDSEAARSLDELLTRDIAGTQIFHTRKRKLLDTFFKTKYKSLVARNTAWDRLQTLLDGYYDRFLKSRATIRNRMGVQIADLIGKQFGADSRKVALTQFKRMGEILKQLGDEMQDFRRSLVDMPPDERPAAWSKFLGETELNKEQAYKARLVQRMKIDIDAADQIFDSLKGKKKPPEATPTAPPTVPPGGMPPPPASAKGALGIEPTPPTPAAPAAAITPATAATAATTTPPVWAAQPAPKLVANEHIVQSAERAGILQDIQDLAKYRLTDDEIVRKLADRGKIQLTNPTIHNDFEQMVAHVRAKYGIPEMDAPEFDDWLAKQAAPETLVLLPWTEEAAAALDKKRLPFQQGEPIRAALIRRIAQEAEYSVTSMDENGMFLPRQDQHILSIVNLYGEPPVPYTDLGSIDPEIARRAFWARDAQKAYEKSLQLEMSLLTPEQMAEWQAAQGKPPPEIWPELEATVGQPRENLPPNVSQALQDEANAMLGELRSGEFVKGRQMTVNGEDIYAKGGTSNAPWYSRLYQEGFKSREQVDNALQRIIDDAGKDRGDLKYVRRLKELIMDRLMGGGTTEMGMPATPPHPGVLLFLGREDDAARALGDWMTSDWGPNMTDEGWEKLTGTTEAFDRLLNRWGELATEDERQQIDLQDLGTPIPAEVLDTTAQVIQTEHIQANADDWQATVDQSIPDRRTQPFKVLHDRLQRAIDKAKQLADENAGLKERVTELRKDIKTGFLNGGAKEVEAEVRAWPYKLVVDIPGMGWINREGTPQAGDEFLAGVALNWLDAGYKEDEIARIGGDEFIFRLNSPDEVAAAKAKISRAVSETPILLYTETGHKVKRGLPTYFGDDADFDIARKLNETAKKAWAKETGYVKGQQPPGVFDVIEDATRQRVEQTRAIWTTRLEDFVNEERFGDDETWAAFIQTLKSQHKEAVRMAFEDGAKVPDDVLADYPDLQALKDYREVSSAGRPVLPPPEVRPPEATAPERAVEPLVNIEDPELQHAAQNAFSTYADALPKEKGEGLIATLDNLNDSIENLIAQGAPENSSIIHDLRRMQASYEDSPAIQHLRQSTGRVAKIRSAWEPRYTGPDFVRKSREAIRKEIELAGQGILDPEKTEALWVVYDRIAQNLAKESGVPVEDWWAKWWGDVNQGAKPQEWEMEQQPLAATEPAFQEWFGKSQIADDQGKPQVVYHGTTHDFTTFDAAKTGMENHFGKGFYFTNSPEDVSTNYAGIGPDLTNRIEWRADELMNDWKGEGGWGSEEYKKAYELAKEQAKKELAGNSSGLVMPVYLKMENPLDLRKKGSVWTLSIDEAGNESGNALRLHDGIMRAADELGADGKKIWGELLDSRRENLAKGDYAQEIDKALRGLESVIYMEDPDTGALVSNEFLRRVYQYAGHDGIIMEGANTGTAHYIVWDPSQIKSVFNRGTFDPSSANVLYQTGEVVGPLWYSQLQKSIEALPEGKIGTGQLMNKLSGAGVKARELQWTDFDEWIQGKKSVDKQEALNFLKGSESIIDEVRLGGRPYVTPGLRQAQAELDAAKANLANVLMEHYGYANHEDAVQRVELVTQGINLYPNYETYTAIAPEPTRPALDRVMRAMTAVKNETDQAANLLETRYNNPSWMLPDGKNYGETVLTWKTKPTIDIEAITKQIDELVTREDWFTDEMYDLLTQNNQRSADLAAALTGAGLDDREIDNISRNWNFYGVQRAKELLGADHPAIVWMDKYVGRMEELRGEVAAIRVQRREFTNRIHLAETEGTFESGHWDGIANPIVHIRHNERVDADGKKMLFAEEFQSDWDQKIAALGIRGRTKVPPSTVAEVLGEHKVIVGQQPAEGRAWTVTNPADTDLAMRGYIFERKVYKTYRGGMPQAPQEWIGHFDELQPYEEIPGLQYAIARPEGEKFVLNGIFPSAESAQRQIDEWKDWFGPEKYTYQTWIQGTIKDFPTLEEATKDLVDIQQHAMQHYLDNQGVPDMPWAGATSELAFRRFVRMAAEQGFDRIGWTDAATQTERWSNALRQVVDKLEWTRHLDPEGQGVLRGWKGDQAVITEFMKADKLPDYVGGSLAKQLIEDAAKSSDNTGRVKGDQIIVGGEIYKKIYEETMPGYAKKFGKKWSAQTGETHLANNAEAERWVNFNPNTKEYDVYAGPGEHIYAQYKGSFATLEEANSFIKELPELPPGRHIFYMDITPEMRESVVKYGNPLFQQRKGAISFAEDGRGVIRMLEAADLSTFVHEPAHVWRRSLGAADMNTLCKWITQETGYQVRHSKGLFVGETHPVDFAIGGKKMTFRNGVPELAEEMWSYGLEQLLREGVVQSKEAGLGAKVAEVLRKFTRWISEIYAGLKGTPLVNVSPEMRDIYERLLSENPDIIHADGSAGWMGTDQIALFPEMNKLALTPEKATESIFKPQEVAPQARMFPTAPEMKGKKISMEVIGKSIFFKKEDGSLWRAPWTGQLNMDINGNPLGARWEAPAHMADEILNQAKANAPSEELPLFGITPKPAPAGAAAPETAMPPGAAVTPEPAMPAAAQAFIKSRPEAINYVGNIRGKDRRAYAADYHGWILDGRKDPEPTPPESLTPGVIKGIKMSLDEIYAKPERKIEGPLFQTWFETDHGPARLLGKDENDKWMYQIGDEAKALSEGDDPPAMNLPPGTISALDPEPPIHKITREGFQDQIWPAMQTLRERMMGAGGRVGKGLVRGALPADAENALRAYLARQYGHLADMKLAGISYAQKRRDFALLNYARRYGADNVAQTIIPYEFWYGRQAMNWALRAFDKPSWFANYARLRSAQYNMGGQPEGYPQRLEGKMSVRIPFLPPGWGKNFYFDPLHRLFAFEQLAQPLHTMQRTQNQQESRAEYILQSMAADDQITADQMRQAIDTKTGDVWQKALAQAQNEIQADISNPFDFMSAISGPSLPIGIAYNIIKKQPEKISQLPATRLLQSVTAGLTPGGWSGPEGWLRRMLGQPERGNLWEYYVDRELGNMAKLDPTQIDGILQAMADKSGPLYDQAMSTVGKQQAVRNFASVIWGDLFPEGEAGQRELQGEFSKAIDTDSVGQFFEDHPEYRARLEMHNWDDPQERLSSYLRSEIWSNWNSASDIDKKAIKEGLGDLFQTAFLNKETRSYDSIPTLTLANWAKSLGDYLPAGASSASAAPLQMPGASLNQAYSQFETGKAQLFGGKIDQTLGVYYTLTGDMQDKFALEHPEIVQYQEYRDTYIADHPDLIPYMISQDSELAKADQETAFLVYQYRAARAQKYPGVLYKQLTYYGLPAGLARHSYLANNPDLPSYWDWNRGILDSMPQIKVFVKGFESMSNAALPAGYREPYQVDPGKFSPPVVRQLLGYVFAGQPLSPGIESALEVMWEQEGKPVGTFQEWLSYVMRHIGS